MAVQAQYASNLLLFNRGEQERKEMEYPQQQQQQQQQPHGFVYQSSTFFANGDVGVIGNQRKRGRDAEFQMVPTPNQAPQINIFSSSIQSPTFMNLAQLQQQLPPTTPLVSTGLRLSFEDNSNSSSSSSSNLFVGDDVAYLINQQRDELDQYLVAQGEQLRRALAERRQRHYCALLATAEKSAARRLRLKELELSQVACRTAELEDRLHNLQTESMTWQAKAMSDQAAAASLHAQIQQAQQATAAAVATANNRMAEAGDECCGESAAGDAESAHVDPVRVQGCSRGVCRACRVSGVSVVVLPCRHLCMCSACDAAASVADAAARCPVCHAVRAGSVQVFFSGKKEEEIAQ